MKKKVLSLLIVGVMLVYCIVPSVSAAPKSFIDVKQGEWYYTAVMSVVDKGLFSGVSDTRFAPGSSMTRAMFVKALANFTTNYTEPDEKEPALFTDVKKGEWYYGAVQWAAKNKIVSGVGNGRFNPTGNITRQEMVAMLFNYAVAAQEPDDYQMDALKKYNDRQKIATWAEKPFAWAVCHQIVEGTGPKTLSPTATATRAQAATIFNNAYDSMQNRQVPPEYAVSEKVEIPENLVVSLDYKDTSICTVTLPESYRDCIIYRKELAFEGGLFFYEPLQEQREMHWYHGGKLFSIRVLGPGQEYTGESLSELWDDMTDRPFYAAKDFEMKGEIYRLLVQTSAFRYDGADTEFMASFEKMLPEVGGILDSLIMNPALRIIEEIKFS